MTVAELIAALAALPPDARVVVDGYEGGYSDPRVLGAVARLGHGVDYEGDHAEVDARPDPGDPCDRDPQPGDVACVLLSRDDYHDCSYACRDYDEAAEAIRRLVTP